MDQVSSHEGAEMPDEVGGVSLDDPAFWRELSSALGVANDHRTGLEEASDASSDFSDDDSDAGSSSDSTSDNSDIVAHNLQTVHHPSSEFMTIKGAQQASSSAAQSSRGAEQIAAAVARQRCQPSQDDSSELINHSNYRQHEGSDPQQSCAAPSFRPHFPAVLTEQSAASNSLHARDGHPNVTSSQGIPGHAHDLGAETATDSDDEGYEDDVSFMQAYDQTLEQQLADSRVGSLLQPGLAKSAAEQGNTNSTSHGGVSGRSHDADQKEDEEEMKPIDLDTNLVQNLLQSYAAQEGLAGPAGNLAGLLGLQLPHNAE